MACKTSFELHHHFPKLAEESGFTFNTHRPRIHIDWNKIRLIDLDSLIKERKFVIIEQHLNDILDCVLESEFDVRILDEGVMKLFRLAQLAVEYQQFCRHYLDRSVYVLKDEITSLAQNSVQELDTCKKDLREKDDEIRRLRKKSRHNYKTALPYGNDNIATMILKTLSHKGDMFPSTSNEVQYNKCSYCEKVFLNQLYLKSHISRRHPNIIDMPQRDKQDNIINNENTKLSAEVNELRNKLKEMETIIANTNKQMTATETKEKIPVTNNNVQETKKETKDAEVSTNNEEYLLNKIEEWKKQEHDNYNKEMDKLRNQIMETIQSLKDKESEKSVPVESNIIEKLHETIKQQGAEILALKKELSDSRIKTEKENAERSKESAARVAFWTNRAEEQSRQYELLLQKLNDVANDAKESRALAEAERERAAQLQILLQQSIIAKTNGNIDTSDDVLTPNKTVNSSNIRKKTVKKKINSNKSEPGADRNTLEQLHRKAQELLNVASVTSSSSETSSVENEILLQKPVNMVNKRNVTENISNKPKHIEEKPKHLEGKHNQSQNHVDFQKLSNAKPSKVKREKVKSNHIKNSADGNMANSIPGSPMKLVRAKITEEVNSRLVSAGVDPLKPRLPRSIFQKQRMLIHQQQEIKSKKNPALDKARHTILAYLDSSTTNLKKEYPQIQDYVSPTKPSKSFKNLTTVISNVKTKALSLVKMNDANLKDKRKLHNAEITKRAISLLKTPPGSASTSPATTSRSPLKVYNVTQNSHNLTNPNANLSSKDFTNKVKNSLPNSPKSPQMTTATSHSDEGSDDSNHKYYNTTKVQSSKSVESLIKSPARRPSSATTDYNQTVKKYTISDDNLLRSQSASSLIEKISTSNGTMKNMFAKDKPINDNSSDDCESLSDNPIESTKKNVVDVTSNNTVKITKSVLKNASSISSLNKKKVLFDMDAIQMKSVSASPSQSTTEKSDGNEKYELGLVNLDGEEWDISSIENEPLKIDTKIQHITRTSPKIAELKQKIESQLARRNETPTSPLVGGVDVLAGSMVKAASITGSNTSLGSSILDDSESAPIVNRKPLAKAKKLTAKDDSDIDISEFSIDGIANKNESF